MIVLGGAFFCDGNVNPAGGCYFRLLKLIHLIRIYLSLAAEANIIGDPEAADFVLGMASSIRVVGLDVTHRCQIPVASVKELRGRGKYGTFIEQVTRFYIQYHRSAHLHAIVSSLSLLVDITICCPIFQGRVWHGGDLCA
jgi:inosine-uridine nucleoside N-ribohydrolase